METIYPNYDKAVKEFKGFCKAKKINSKSLLPWPKPINDSQKNTNAYEMAKLIVLDANKGKVPNPLDTNQWKHWPYFVPNPSGSGLSYGDFGRWTTAASVPARLCSLESKNVAKLAKKYPAIYDILQR